MKTRPVFESFEEFVYFINEAEKEKPMDYKGFISSNVTFLDEDAKKGFNAASKAAMKAPLCLKDKNVLPTEIGNVLSNLNSIIKDEISDNAKSTEAVLLAEKTKTEVKTLVYPALVNGKVNIGNVSALGGNASALKSAFAKYNDGAWIDISDLLTLLNIENIAMSDVRINSKDGKGKKWAGSNVDDNYIQFSGAYGQHLISSIASGISLVDNGSAIPGKAPKMLEELKFATKEAEPVKGTTRAHSTLVLYGVGNLVQGGGGTIPDSFIKKEFTTEVVQGESKPYQVPIDGSDAMFKQGSSELNMKNKDKIDKVLTAALAPLAGKPESIVITGGASYEPDGQGPINKKLVVDRANAVKTYLETLYPALKGVISVNDTDFSKIQEKDVPAEYEKYRKVYLDIKGVLLGNSYTINKEIEYFVDEDINADSIEIIQYAITREYDLNFDKEEKK